MVKIVIAMVNVMDGAYVMKDEPKWETKMNVHWVKEMQFYIMSPKLTTTNVIIAKVNATVEGAEVIVIVILALGIVIVPADKPEETETNLHDI